MSCLHPLLAIKLLDDRGDGKSQIKILPSRVDFNINSLKQRYGDSLLTLPCGQCLPCKMAKRKEWSTRCMLEADKYGDENIFVTLTYSDECRPDHVIKNHFSKFIKSIRNAGYRVRYFACSERGSLHGNLHWHAILFGFKPKDLKYLTTSKNGDPYYSSDFLNSIWKYGFVTIGAVSQQSCSYVAGYVGKKLDGSTLLLMSTRPGIGFDYFKNNLDDIYQYDNIVVPFGSHSSKVPRYCDKIAGYVNKDITAIKDKRILRGKLLSGAVMSRAGVVHPELMYQAEYESLIKKVRCLKRGF